MTALEPAAERCLDRTRSAVLNVLIAIGAGIAVSGLVLRWRDRGAIWRAPDKLGQGLLAGLFLLVVTSFLVRRIGSSRSRLHDPKCRASRFYRAHLASAVIGSLAVFLGLCYGWWIRPRLDAVSPFWVASLALGFLALPRADELRDFEEPIPEPNEPTR
jgi:Na+/H+-dicarboxylate symporter